MKVWKHRTLSGSWQFLKNEENPRFRVLKFKNTKMECDGKVTPRCSQISPHSKSKTARGWVCGPTGVHTSGWGLVLTPQDMIKLGQLYLNGGEWKGTQIVLKEWITQSTEVKSNWKTRKYGLLWWVIDEQEKSFAALGDGGNVIYVNPKEQIVIAIGSYFKPRVLDRMALIKEYIEPMLISNFDVV